MNLSRVGRETLQGIQPGTREEGLGERAADRPTPQTSRLENVTEERHSPQAPLRTEMKMKN